MPLTNGTRIGVHEILSALGGMGEVYRARDTKFVRTPKGILLKFPLLLSWSVRDLG